MPSDQNDAPPPAPEPNPMSRKASRRFVIIGLLLAFLLALASVFYLLDVAESRREAPPAPADTTQVETPSLPPGTP